MIIWNPNRPMDESVEAAEGIFGEQVTPAHYYSGKNDFNIILEDMITGAIPINTHQPYPVIWKADIEELEKQRREQQNLPPFEGPYRTINGIENLYR
jgi:hypothetical protein